MSISSLRIKNFKRFSDLKINLNSKINLLLGPNSSGKSSFIKAILAFKQTSSSANEHEVFSAQGDYVDLGLYKDYVFKHDIKNNISFEFELKKDIYETPWSGSLVEEKSSITFEYSYDPISQQAKIHSLKIFDNKHQQVIDLTKKKTSSGYFLKCSNEFSAFFTNEYLFSENDAEASSTIKLLQDGVSTELIDKYKIIWQKPKQSTQLTQSKKYSYKQIASVEISNFLSNYISYFFRIFEKSFFYLGPLRRSPSRSYSRTSHIISTGNNGEHTPSVLANLQSLASKERSKEKKYTNRLIQLNKWVSWLLPDSSIKAKTIEELVKLEINRNSDDIDIISDVGFGISQILPILVQISVMPENSVLLIEQPELHLHPKAQSKFSEIIVDASSANRKLIIETHSEHIIRGLQLAISNKRAKINTKHSIDRNEVNITYIPISPKQAQKMEIDENGDFTNEWPAGFFDESYQVSLKILKNKMIINSIQ